ncbi:hypothetical protein CBS101457_002781 [Exobasidium rhododendri]|nr:hypothetical protein CBS101457_002781 [Exobasidium rhododendri]
MDKDFYSFAKLCDVQLPLTLRIASLQGRTIPPRDIYITVRLFADNKPLTPAYQTSYKYFKKGSDFNELIVFPIKLADLPLSSQVTFTVWDAADISDIEERFEADEADMRGSKDIKFTRIIGGSTLKLFGKKGTLKKASHRLFLWPDQAGDGSAETSTPSKIAHEPNKKRDEMARLEKLIKLHERSDLPHLLWLDKLAYRQIEKVHAEESLQSNDIYLYIDLPRFETPIVYCEQETINLPPSVNTNAQAAQGGNTYADPATASSASRGIDASLFTVYDGDMLMERENLVEAKHRRLVRSHRSGPLDRELKPNAKVRDELNDILSYPPTRPLTTSESDLLWSFRFYLTRFEAGLTKFLKSVSWTDQGEAKQATEALMPMWNEIGMDDALELLGPGFKDGRVKAYAVKTLERADDEELLLYLLQLVQALKFDIDLPSVPTATVTKKGQTSSKPSMTSMDHTYVPSPSSSSGATTAVNNSFEEGGLANFLIRRAIKNAILGNNLYWYLEVECEDHKFGKMFRRIRSVYLDRLGKSTQGAALRETFRRQNELLKVLSSRAKELRLSKDARPKKIEKMRAMINDARNGLNTFDPPLPLPLDARVHVTGIKAESSSVFKSNLFPLLLQFETQDEDQNTYSVIFKNGDDLRQDQLVIQLFSLMDRLLRNENLDLCITPYKVLATGAVDGMVQFVESTTLASILSQHQNNLQNYMRSHHPDQSEEAIFGIKASVFETYLRSCAGYCVVTYLLGVGDRHLDNLLLAPDGHFFHVDFGYILNRDPKPFAPAVKLSKEMVDAMGGTTSIHYIRFKKFCFTAFITLRKNSNLILNLINLMIDANVTDIRLEPDKAVLKVQEKFKLDLSDEEAIQFFDEMLNEPSYMTLMFDRLHGAAQFFRS